MFYYSSALVVGAIYLALKYIYSHWDRHEIPYVNPNWLFGNLETVAKKTESFGVAISKIYWNTKDQLVGIYLFFRPAILIRDPHLAHRIMTTDFSSFHDRGVYCNEEGDPFSAHLFALPGKRWKDLRNKLTPAFTSGQLRNMLPTVLDVGRKLQAYLEPIADRSEVIDARDINSRFVMDIVASVLFGFEANCITDSEDSFRTVLRNAQRERLSSTFRILAVFVCPGLLKLVRTTALHPDVINFMMEIITNQIEHREKNNVTRKDVIQQLIDLRKEDTKNGELALSLSQCAANVFLFYIAGADTSTDTITFTLHELSQNPEIMKRLHVEIDEVLKKSNGEINYDVVNEMKLLDLCVKETLRKYPGLPILNRECTQEYRVPGSKVVIKKGTQVIIPLLGYSMDEQYFPEPDRYMPERFDTATKNYDEKAYYPFGEGPRNCIAYRMGTLVAKIGLILLLSKFSFEAVPGSKMEFSTTTASLVPKEGSMNMRISSRK